MLDGPLATLRLEGFGMNLVSPMCLSTMVAVCGARSRPALCTTFSTTALPGTLLGGSQTLLSG
eukprot:487901-Amphidinium_carterae.1